MADNKTILVVGTYDTKDDELAYLAGCIRAQGGNVVTMDVSVLGDPVTAVDHSKHDVAREAGSSIEAVIASGDENSAMQIMAQGSSALAQRLWREGRVDGVVVLGGSMGTDLALDVCAAIPVGVPKYIVSTVAFSPLIPAGRLAADVQMILWAGGLYGLNSLCKSSLSQAAGAVLGAARAVERPSGKPLVGITGLGKSVLGYAVPLKPELEARGFEVAVFHATGMGWRAFESLAAQGAFACVMDFCTQELGNDVNGSDISAGPDRLTGAGKAGIPQIVAPGCYDLVDIAGWRGVPEKWAGHESHAHNRLITSIVLQESEVQMVAQAHCRNLATAKSHSVFLLPTGGCGEWDRPGKPLHNPKVLAAFCDAIRTHCPANVRLEELACHINDQEFADRALAIFDEWCDSGVVKSG
ncbi:MAG: Tm-1-like ATP-binding domain-containing protein [Nitratireductor sp.]